MAVEKLPIDPVAIAQIGASVADSAMNTMGSVKNTEMTIKANRELAEYQYGKQLEMWNLANQYNSPAQQMKRFKEAGLNPNLIYSRGEPGNSPNVLPQYQSPRVEYKYDYNQRLGNAISRYQDTKMRSAQINNVETLTRAQEEEIILKKLAQKRGLTQWEREKFDLEFEKEVRQTKMDKLQADLTGSFFRNISEVERTMNLRADLDTKALQREIMELDKALKSIDVGYATKYGLRQQDPVYTRLIAKLIERLGL